MARRKSVPGLSATPNPLFRMFGTFLRLERKRLRLTSSFVAKELDDISETYYRLIESGRASFNPNLALKLIALLQPTQEPNEMRTLVLERLALYLVGAQCVSSDMALRDGSKGVALFAMEALALADGNFKVFHAKTKEYYLLEEGAEEQKAFLEEVAAPEVGRFLRTAAYARKNEQGLLEQFLPKLHLLKLPSLNVGIIERLALDLAGRPFVHTAAVASDWEERHGLSFRCVSGFYTSETLIINDRNLDRFRYSYLRHKEFESLRFIFALEEKSQLKPRELRAQFLRKVNDKRRRGRLLPLDRDDQNKVKFAVLTATSAREHEADLALLRKSAETDVRTEAYAAYWSFETNSGLPVGFNARDEVDIWNLSLDESIQKAKVFDRIWSAIA